MTVKCPDGVKVIYLTAGKIYEAVRYGHDNYEVVADNGISMIIRLKNCFHLGGKDWIIVEVKRNKKTNWV